jgi:branched-chain amino acid transport system permease protein
MLAQQVANGLLLGAVYVLVALGFTLMFGVLRVVNLTYGLHVTLGAFAALFLVADGGLPVWAALPLAALGTGLFATALDALLLTRLRRARAPELSSLMVTLGTVLALNAALSAWLGPDIRRLPESAFSGGALVVAGVRLTQAQLLIAAAAACLVALLMALLHGTRIGLAVRAMAEQPEAAQLVGIDTARLAALISFASGAMAGAAGVLLALAYDAIQPFMGEPLMLRGFAVVIAGGLGSVFGALVAGLALGLAEVLAAAYVSSSMKEAVAFGMLVLVLWTRPRGLFGARDMRRG